MRWRLLRGWRAAPRMLMDAPRLCYRRHSATLSMPSCDARPKVLPPALRPRNLSRVSERFSKSADRISRKRGSDDKSSAKGMDRTDRRRECRPVIRMLLLPLWLLWVGLPLPLSLCLGLSLRAGLFLSAGAARGAAKPAAAGPGGAATAKRTRPTRATATAIVFCGLFGVP